MLNPLIPYGGFTTFTPTLPEFYWNVYSSEQRIKHICYELCKLAKYDDYLAEQLGLTREDVEKLMADFEKFKESGFDDYYEAQVAQWIRDNMSHIFEQYTRGVYFGLTLDGHFVAYIPESWNDIIFDTGMNYTFDTYGRLILRMDVDSPYDNVDQRPEVVRPYTDEELELKVRNIMNTLYAIGGGGNG